MRYTIGTDIVNTSGADQELKLQKTSLNQHNFNCDYGKQLNIHLNILMKFLMLD